jgi:predicted amidohydrolase YtcJ
MPYRTLAPDLVLTGGSIHTMDAHDRVATAIAIKDGRIVGVGLDDEMRSLAGLGTIEESLDGKTVIPGLVDAHNHLLFSGFLLQEIQLYECRTIPQIVERVRTAVEQAQPGDWIVGRGWDESLLAESRFPSRYDLDPVSPNNPVVLHRVWNKLTCNSAAIRAAGVDRNTPDPPAGVAYSGSFDRDEHGEPTGLFRDRAKELIAGALPAKSAEDYARAVEVASQHYNAVGITSVGEPGLYPAEVHGFHRAHQQNQLSVRTEMMLAGWGFGSVEIETELPARFESMGVMTGFGDEMLRIGGVKFMPDGGIGDRTAKVYEPYEGEPDNRGQWITQPDELTRLIRFVHDLGFAIDTHTCGDEAQQVTVEAYAAAQVANPKPWLRHRVHHAYLPTERTLEIMAAYRIPAVVSDPFLRGLGESYILSLGLERASRMMPMRTYLDRAIPLAGSSDSPVAVYDPWIGFHSAITRETVNGTVLGANERISPRETLRSYTIGGAYALGREREIGSIEPGKLADLVVLDDDPLHVPADRFLDWKPRATMVGGAWVADNR